MDSNKKITLAQIEKHKQALMDSDGDISLTKILNSASCQRIFSECRTFRDRLYTPFKTVFVFIKQVLSFDKSCRTAVASAATEHIITGRKSISTNTGPYCKARLRLPENAVKELVKETGKSSLQYSKTTWKPYGRELKVFDGTTVIMADTVSNQHEYPQHGNQKEGAGFPIARILVGMSLTFGTVLDYAIGAYKGKGTGESTLLRSIFDCINRNDIVLGDGLLPDYFLIANLIRIGADGVFRGHCSRNYDFRKGIRLGKNDHIVKWKKPSRPKWMEQSEYNSYPDEIDVREFKAAGKVYITTLLNGKIFNKKELAKLYAMRWHVELNLKSIKSIMKMDILSCKTPAMVRKEIGIHLLAYNFIRIIMAEACAKYNALPWKISFKGTMQLINVFMPHFINSSTKRNKILYNELLKMIVENKVGNRPGRVEPRMTKQRRESFPALNSPRFIEREKIIKKMERRGLRMALI